MPREFRDEAYVGGAGVSEVATQPLPLVDGAAGVHVLDDGGHAEATARRFVEERDPPRVRPPGDRAGRPVPRDGDSGLTTARSGCQNRGTVLRWVRNGVLRSRDRGFWVLPQPDSSGRKVPDREVTVNESFEPPPRCRGPREPATRK